MRCKNARNLFFTSFRPQNTLINKCLLLYRWPYLFFSFPLLDCMETQSSSSWIEKKLICIVTFHFTNFFPWNIFQSVSCYFWSQFKLRSALLCLSMYWGNSLCFFSEKISSQFQRLLRDSPNSAVVPSIRRGDLCMSRCCNVRVLLLHGSGNDRAGGEAFAVSVLSILLKQYDTYDKFRDVEIFFRFSRLKAWWFHIPVYFVSLLHIYPVYMSWISPEDHSVTLCFSPMAISPDQRVYGKTVWISIFSNNFNSIDFFQLLWVCSIIMFIEDMIFHVYLLAKSMFLDFLLQISVSLSRINAQK